MEKIHESKWVFSNFAERNSRNAAYKATESKSEIHSLSFDSFRVISVQIYDFFKFVGVKVSVSNFFLGQSLGIDENITSQLKFLF